MKKELTLTKFSIDPIKFKKEENITSFALKFGVDTRTISRVVNEPISYNQIVRYGLERFVIEEDRQRLLNTAYKSENIAKRIQKALEE